ncbi:MAG: RNA polymerase sigma factor [Oscillospiraceae bacterium]
MREQEIIAAIRAREEQGAEALLRHYGPLLRYVIAPILPDAQDREECVSEAAMRVWDGIGQYDPGRGSWTAWLTTVARNAALNHARRNRRRAAEGELPEETPSTAPTPEEELLRRERQEALCRALQQLSSGERALFYRKYYYLQPTAQIAAELGMTERAVEGRLYRLKRRLRRMLGGEDHA